MVPRPIAHHPPRRPRRIAWGVLLPWIVTLGLLAGTAAYVFWPSEPELRSPVKPGRDGALIWSDGVFANALELEAWLRIRGVSYRQWARRHPAAVKLLAPEPKPAKPAVKGQAKATPKPAPAKVKATAKAKATPAAKETLAAPPATSTAAGSHATTFAIAALIAVLLLWSATLVVRFLRGSWNP